MGLGGSGPGRDAHRTTQTPYHPCKLSRGWTEDPFPTARWADGGITSFHASRVSELLPMDLQGWFNQAKVSHNSGYPLGFPHKPRVSATALLHQQLGCVSV